MSERRLKLGHRKEYKRKSKHTRNPSYYPRHLTKVTLADFDADFNLRISKEVAAQRGYGRKVLDKSCHIAWDHGYGYVKESRIVKFIAKYVGKPYKEPAKAWNEWIKPIEIIELQTEAANLEAVSNKATAMAEKIGGLLS